MITPVKEFLLNHLYTVGILSTKEALENHYDSISKLIDQYILTSCAPGTRRYCDDDDKSHLTFYLDDAILELFEDGIIRESEEDEDSFYNWLWSVELQKRKCDFSDTNPESYYEYTTEDKEAYKDSLKKMNLDEISLVLREAISAGNYQMFEGMGWLEWPFTKIRWVMTTDAGNDEK
jgi:hypothetical protein